MNRTILIVDDIEINRDILKKILGKEYDIMEVENGEDAIALLNREYRNISAVLLDLTMPVMDGFEVLTIMRSSPVLFQIPVIVTTGKVGEDSESRALSLGANDYITKPYNSTIIRQRIKNTINLRETSALVNELQRDRLTGLFSRETFFDKAHDIISAHESGYYVMSCFDIDNFKVINDQFGTDTGDDILKHVASCFKEWSDSIGGLCSRVTGDNFALLFRHEYIDDKSLMQCRIKASYPDCINRPIIIRAGYYIINNISLSCNAMYDRASMAAMSINGRYDTNTAIFNESMRNSLIEEQQIINEMSDALDEEQFELWLQPQYSLSSGARIGAEALARWNHPEKGIISPTVFIPIFEQSGFVYQLDKYMWEQSCRYLRKWTDEGKSPLPISVNISRIDLFQEDLVDTIINLTGKYKISPDLLHLEITESAFAESAEHIINVVNQLIEFGFTVEIDDFGSGYSSLNTLKDVPAQVLKLDMRFLDSQNRSRRGGNILESVIRMAKWLGMVVLAEGVETAEQASYLKSIGCNYVQGFLYNRPMHVADYEASIGNITKDMRKPSLKTIKELDNNSLWDPESMETLIFNSYIGGACIFEYHDASIEILRANDKFVNALNSSMTIEDALKLDWYNHLEHENSAEVRAALQESINTDEDVTIDCIFIDLPGSPGKTYLRCTMRVIASTGDRYLVYSTNENITAQRISEMRELMISEQMQSIMNNVNGGVSAVTFKEGGTPTILFSNKQCYEMFGYTKEQAKDTMFATVPLPLFPDDIEVTKKNVEKLLDNRIPISFDFRCIKNDGNIMYVHCNSSVTHFSGIDGDVIISVLTDVTKQMEFMEQLRVSEESNRLAIKHSGSIICRYSITDKTSTISDEIAELFGIPAKITDMPYGAVNSGLIAPESAETYISMYEDIQRGKPEGSLIFMQMFSNKWSWIQAHYSTIFSKNGEPRSAVISLNDITDILEKETAYKKWTQSLHGMDPELYSLLRCNLSRNKPFDSMEGLLLKSAFGEASLSFDEMTSSYAEQYVAEEDRQKYIAFLKPEYLVSEYSRGKRSDSLEYRHIISESEERWICLKIDLVEYPSTTDIEIYMMYEDIDKSKRDELLTIRRSQTDPLTGVLNRTAFIAEIESVFKSSKPDKKHALLMLDIDHFKLVNDVFGHTVGDQTLIDVAESVDSILGKNDLFGRIGGDEFIILLNDISGNAAVSAKASQICSLIRRSYSMEVQISGSIGITLWPQDGNDFETLYKKADSALYYAKGSGRDNHIFYLENMQDENMTPEEDNDKASEKKRRMLIVDDSKIDIAMLSNMFRDKFIVEKARDGNSALIRLRHYGSAISVVLLDLMMPGMSGFDVLEKMQENAELAAIPVIVVSSDEDRDTVLKALRCGAADYITKPVDPSIIRLRVKAAISKADNDRLQRINNSLLVRNSVAERYRIVLEQSNIVVIEYDWLNNKFTYDPSIADHISGVYNNRPLWTIFLSDRVADTMTVKKLQGYIHEFALDSTLRSGRLKAVLRTPSGQKHMFHIRVFKQLSEFNLTSKIIIAFFDMGPEKTES